MKVIVLQKFKDKHTGEIHKTGKVMNVSKKRYEEILTVDKFVEEYKETAEETAEETTETTEETADETAE